MYLIPISLPLKSYLDGISYWNRIGGSGIDVRSKSRVRWILIPFNYYLEKKKFWLLLFWCICLFTKISDNIKACWTSIWASQVELWWIKYRTGTRWRQWSDLIVRAWVQSYMFGCISSLFHELDLTSISQPSSNIQGPFPRWEQYIGKHHTSPKLQEYYIIVWKFNTHTYNFQWN